MKQIALLGCLLLTGCETFGKLRPPPPTDSYCQIHRPVLVSPADTRSTKEQADRELRKWKAACQRD